MLLIREYDIDADLFMELKARRMIRYSSDMAYLYGFSDTNGFDKNKYNHDVHLYHRYIYNKNFYHYLTNKKYKNSPHYDHSILNPILHYRQILQVFPDIHYF